MDGIPFSIHCTQDDRFVTKLMSMHRLLTEVDDHKTYRQKDGAWVSFKYVEYTTGNRRAYTHLIIHNVVGEQFQC